MQESFQSPKYVHNTKTYQLHDVSIESNTGHMIKASITYSCNGELMTTCAEYTYKKIGNSPLHMVWFQDSHLGEIGGFVDEVIAELKEDAAYLRDSDTKARWSMN